MLDYRSIHALVAAVSLALTPAKAAAVGLQAGCARVEITPRVDGGAPVWIAGYGQNRRATGVHDPLYATALALSDGERTFALATVDLVGLQYGEVLRIRAQLGDLDYVLVASTHNHEGPDVVGIWGPNPLQSGVDPAYLDLVVERTVRAIRSAVDQLRPAAASYGTARTPPELLRDSRLPVVRDDVLRAVMLRAEDTEEPLAVLVQYSCHPESLGSDNTLLTADFPYATIAALEKRYGCPVAYFTGAVGGLMTHPHEFAEAGGRVLRDGEFEYAEAYGRAIARVAVEAIEAARPIAMTPLRAATVDVAAPLSNRLYAAARAMGVLQRAAVEYAGDWHDVSRPATSQTPLDRLAIRTEVACLEFGEVRAAAIPGEIYPELVYGQFQEPADPGADYPEAPLEPTAVASLQTEYPLIFGLANDEIGYIIPRRQWDERPPYAYGRNESQYGEINSCGAAVAPIVMEALREAAQRLRD